MSDRPLTRNIDPAKGPTDLTAYVSHVEKPSPS